MVGARVHTGVWWGNLKERGHLENLGVNGRILQWALKKYEGKAWAGFSSVRVGTTGGLLWIW
jgi:hypothetical protein